MGEYKANEQPRRLGGPAPISYQRADDRGGRIRTELVGTRLEADADLREDP